MKKWLGLGVLLVLLLGACGNEAYETIGIEEVEAKQEAGYTVLDVREPYEYESGHIAGAVNAPLSELREGSYNELPKDGQYVVICQTGNRSQEATTILDEAGYEAVNVSEGMSSWEGAVE